MFECYNSSIEHQLKNAAKNPQASVSICTDLPISFCNFHGFLSLNRKFENKVLIYVLDFYFFNTTTLPYCGACLCSAYSQCNPLPDLKDRVLFLKEVVAGWGAHRQHQCHSCLMAINVVRKSCTPFQITVWKKYRDLPKKVRTVPDFADLNSMLALLDRDMGNALQKTYKRLRNKVAHSVSKKVS